MKKQSVALLKELTEATGLPGYEEEIRQIVRRHVRDLARVSTDSMGNIICEKRGEAKGPRIVLPGHMDEIGFLVSGVTAEGFLRFTNLGGWWDQVLLAQRVTVKSRKGDYVGVIGSKPPHGMPADERNKVVQAKDMYIDVGAKDKKEATGKMGIRLADPIVPICPFQTMHNKKLLMGKAFDDRAGVAMMVDTLRTLKGAQHPNTVYGVGTVQEEIGTRGAKTIGHTVRPDVAIILEVGLASDIPGAKAEDKEKGTLGKGPQICFLDAGMVPNLKLRDFMVDLAEKLKIPYQIMMISAGATDGMQIHVHGAGVPSVYIGVPTRYIHSHAGILHADDYENAVKLVSAAVRRLDAKTVKSFQP